MSNVCILGLGLSGTACAYHALAQGDTVCVYAGIKTPKSAREAVKLEKMGAAVYFDTEDVEGPFDLCIASPGIPQTGSFYQAAKAASAELVSEPEYAWRQSPEGWVAVTGTNGKTTTTALIAHVLNECHMNAVACGNIGDTAIEAVEAREAGQVLVAELSSYQLASSEAFCPKVAVLLNITPDHLSWHGSFEAYAQAKLSMFDRLKAGCTAVICDNVEGFDTLREQLEQRKVNVMLVGSTAGAGHAYLSKDGVLVCETDGAAIELCRADELKIYGAHNISNALAASCAALALGCASKDIASALRSFNALEHRIEPCGSIDGVDFFNDSKATNVDATLKALDAFSGRGLVLLLGGTDKGTDLSELVSAARGACKAVVCYGQAGRRIYDAFSESGVDLRLAQGMRDAFELACDIASAPDVVVLSPACASFDEFDSFEHRGRVFKELVKSKMGNGR